MTWGGNAVAGNSTESGRSVTSKITSILMTFTEGSEHCLTEIARLAGLPISTAHRLTAELTSWRLLERTPDGLYRAGLPLRMERSLEAARGARGHDQATAALEVARWFDTAALWMAWRLRPRHITL